MPRSNLPPDDAHELDGILRRLERLERAPGGPGITQLRKLVDVTDRPVLDDGDVPTWNGSKFAFTSAAGDSFWAYNAGTDTLSPDSATTTPLETFTVTAGTQAKMSAADAPAVGWVDASVGPLSPGEIEGQVGIHTNDGGDGGHLYATFFSRAAHPATSKPAECGFSLYSDSTTNIGPFFEMSEAPVAPSGLLNTGRIFMRDVGGKTQLAVQFGTGAVQVIATEP